MAARNVVETCAFKSSKGLQGRSDPGSIPGVAK